MGSLDVESLKIAFSTASSLNEWATVVVVLGVVIELVALLIFGKDMSRTEKGMLIVGSVLVVVGVGGEYIFGGRASAAAARLQQISDEKITEAKNDAAHAIFQAAALGVQEKNLDQYVKDQKARVDRAITSLNAEERTLRIVAKKADVQDSQLRADLTKSEVALKQAADIAAKAYKRTQPRQMMFCLAWQPLKMQPKVPVEILYLKNASDAFLLAIEIDNCLDEVGWSPTYPKPIPEKHPSYFPQPDIEAVGGSDSGVTVVGSHTASISADHGFGNLFAEGSPENAVSNALLSALGDGIYSSIARDVPDGTIRIVVGPKP